jgi:hypothetical protein
MNFRIFIFIAVFFVPGFAQDSLIAMLQENQKDFEVRKGIIVEKWLDQYKEADFSDIGKWNKNGLRKLAAGLIAIQMKHPKAPSASFPMIVENWIINNAHEKELVGTSGSSFDMFLIQMIQVLYLFKNSPELMSKNAQKHLLFLRDSRGPFQKYMIGNSFSNMTFKVGGNTFPETENHVIMINAYRFLATQLSNELGLTRFALNNSEIEAQLLAIIGRIPQNGLFETNARMYQSLTTHTLLTLYSYSDSTTTSGAKIKKAAQNALDYIFLKHSLQSMKQMRYGVQRRNWDYRHKEGLIQSDYMFGISDVLAGQSSHFLEPKVGKQQKGYALWTALQNYRLPLPILSIYHDPSLGVDGNGIWSRMHPHFTDAHYNKGTSSRYATVVDPHRFHPKINKAGHTNLMSNPDLSQNKPQVAPEFYFKNKDYLISSGGRYNHFPALQLASIADKINVYDLFSKPSSIITQKTFAWRDLEGAMEESVLSLGRQKQWKLKHSKASLDWHCKWIIACYYGYGESEWNTTEEGFIRSNNIAVYKNMIAGYSFNPQKPPISIPPSFGTPIHNIKLFNNGIQYTLQLFQPDTSSGLESYYALYTQFKSKITVDSTKYLAIMELVPHYLFDKTENLMDQWIIYNNYYNDLDYSYQSLSSQEKLSFHPNFGIESFEFTPPFQRISNSRDSLNLTQVFHFDSDSLSMPLIEAWVVNHEYQFENKKFIENPEIGLIYIHHPIFGKYTIDSRNFLLPK